MEKLVSLVTPTFNRKSMLADLRRSILDQEYKHWEWIIVDDGSTDNTFRLVRRWSDHRINYIRFTKNRGTSFAKNEGILKSNGEFIAPIDSDDLLTVNSITVRVRALEKDRQCLWIHGRAIELRGTDRKPHDIMHKRWLNCMKRPLEERYQAEKYYSCVHANTVMMRRSFFQKLGLYDETLMRCEDKELWRRALLFGLIPAYTEEFVCLYRFHPGQITVTRRSKQDRYRELSRKKAELRFREGINSGTTRLLA